MTDEDFLNDQDDEGDRREIYKKKNSEEQCNTDEQDLQQYIQDYLKQFEDILNQIDEDVDELDSYGKTMEVKRSIDRLIETLYSKAASEDIDTELETTKHTRDKVNSVKRINEKKKAIEETLIHILAQQQREKNLVKDKQHSAQDVKKQIKSSIKEVLFSVIANRMDPKKRAGETSESNEKHAHIYGREATSGLLSKLLKTFLSAVRTAIHEIANEITKQLKQSNSHAQKVEESRNNSRDEGRSH
ncbi:MAG: hypothetical protein QWI36_04820 [Wolbachia endosymbiont of Tyrophagus putrescentiae]|nr:hypothetical protein [Wolbachia endosymbiont of Tyrophagus putrescentiae]